MNPQSKRKNNMKALAFLILVSCATSTHYMKQSELRPYKKSSKVTKTILGETQGMKLVSIEDKRKTSSYGKAFTGLRYDENDVLMNVGFDKFMRDFIVNSFEMRNLVIDDQAKLVLRVEVHQLWVEEVIEKFKAERAKCRVDLVFHIDAPKAKWSGQYITEFISAGDMTDGTARLAPTLASCMNDAIEKLVLDKKFLQILK